MEVRKQHFFFALVISLIPLFIWGVKHWLWFSGMAFSYLIILYVFRINKSVDKFD